ncbi:2OG-Fe(II) oxygenase, partial [bacterium]|nr:2OG-Fe(II) oxygenase [bacterium]
NDNYNGGDIEFYVDGKFVNHKPKAGDLMIFPSGEPYYHGVKTIPDGNKFFIRNFVMFDYDGSEEWIKNQKRYGAYKWAQKELERVAYDDPRNMLYVRDGKIIPYEDLIDNRPLIEDIYK